MIWCALPSGASGPGVGLKLSGGGGVQEEGVCERERGRERAKEIGKENDERDRERECGSTREEEGVRARKK